MFCLYSRHLCSRDRLAGFDFCLSHILEDKSAPFKQCNFHLKAQKRCQRPASKTDKKDGYCLEHSRRALIARQKTGRKRPADFTQRCLEDLSHYKRERLVPVKKDPAIPVVSAACSGSSGGGLPENNHMAAAATIKTEVGQGDVFDLLSTSIPSISQRVIDGSEVESEEDTATVETAWRGDGDSDAESVDSDLEDPLKHAGAYSAEEVIRIMRDKLIRLQKLYIDQFQRLHYLLREERRQYRHGLCREKEELFMSIQSQPKESAEEQAAYEKIKSLVHYSKPQGVEAVLHAQLMEKRIRASEGANFKPAAVAKCTHNLTTSTKCGEVCIPMAKYCVKHILEDPSQVLFRACNFVTEADGPCETPIPDVLEGSTCIYHTQILPSVFDEKEQERRDSKEDHRHADEVKPVLLRKDHSVSDEPPQSIILPELWKAKN